MNVTTVTTRRGNTHENAATTAALPDSMDVETSLSISVSGF